MVFYNKLNNMQSSGTIAITSNNKFFSPLDAIYWKNWVPVYKLDNEKVKNQANRRNNIYIYSNK